MKENSFRNGMIDGLPIGFGYFSVAFAFGIFALKCGLKGWQAVLISATNLTSAGQLAAVPIIAGGESLLELASTQLIINMRYFLMSIVLSQKLQPHTKLGQKLLIAWANTDEIFAVCTSKQGKLQSKYIYGVILTPYIGWTLGTLAGVLAGDILPDIISESLGVAIYGMLIAVFVSAARDDKNMFTCISIAVAMSIAFRFVSLLSKIPGGFAIIICAVTAAVIMSIIA
ncbi:MAG: AzlC family ABC transporter permease, partial [Erysipelotrichaceae bacterium]|nr:AzlC family ABC transporter permease [Erysipelotrichaceae bacterium]